KGFYLILMLLDQIMPAYYFAMEGYNAGEKHDPALDTLLTIQYQKIDLTTGEPLGALTILKDWESSEESIVTPFYNQFFKPDLPVTHFIPVGMNLDYEFELLLAKVKKYNLPAISSHHLYYKRPRFDLWSIIVLLNDGRFTGARLDAFSPKKFDESHMKKWFEKKDFKKIEHYIREETEGFLKLLQYLTKYKTRLGITKKVAASSEAPEPITPPVRTERSLPAHPKYPEREKPATRSRDDTRAPAPRKTSARISKAEPSSPRSSSGKSKTEGQRTSVPLNQFRKHTPTKDSSGRKTAGRRG
ncbi:MAG: hypothetical protein Q7T80_00035, partial [Methanoregula sp.]|nr:hypothetical protein [Methanoregula sp.]